jgi:hypothetical protein
METQAQQQMTRKDSLKNQLYLLLTGLLCAALAWAFWHYTGQNGLWIIGLIFFLSALKDSKGFRKENRRFKEEMAELKSKLAGNAWGSA